MKLLKTLHSALASSALLISVVSPAAPQANDAFSEAIAKLESARAAIEGVSVHPSVIIEMNEAFFDRINPDALGVREIARAVDLNAYAYSDRAKALAKSTVQRLAPIAGRQDIDGALASMLRVRLSSAAGMDSNELKECKKRVLHHPALASLLQSEFGGMALDVAKSSGANEEDLQIILSLADKLDASKSTAAASSVSYYWMKISGKLPAGDERLEAMRKKLADFTRAALEKEKPDTSKYNRLKTTLDLLNSPAAKGELIGAIAPEINFLWSNRAGWKNLSDLRDKVVMLDFWATWCSGCVASFPEMEKINERYREFDVELVGVTSLQGTIVGLKGKSSVDCRKDPEKEMQLLGEYVSERKLGWPIVISREPAMNPAYGIDGLPTMVILAPDGTVRHVFIGTENKQNKIIEAVDALLAEYNLKVPRPTAAAAGN